jgi:hypothetical protein
MGSIRAASSSVELDITVVGCPSACCLAIANRSMEQTTTVAAATAVYMFRDAMRYVEELH